MKTPEYKMYKYKMMIYFNSKIHFIWYKDIICIRAVEKYIEIVTNHLHYSIKESLHNIEELLPEAFFKCHRSAIVNIACIESFDKNKITTLSKLVLPLAHSLSDSLQQLLLEKERLKVPNCSRCEKCQMKNTCEEISMFVRQNPVNHCINRKIP